MLPNWLYGKSKSKLAELLGGGGTPSDYNQVKAQVTQNTENIGSLDDALDGKAALTQITNPNLLDNPWFTVNQRGATTYNTTGYTIDRWMLYTADTTKNVTVTNGITFDSDFNCNFFEYLEDTILATMLGKDITLSVLLSNGSVVSSTFTFPNSTPSAAGQFGNKQISGMWYMRIYFTGTLWRFEIHTWGVVAPTSLSITAAKLELGSVSTLAMDTAPDYATELLKCQRYFVRLGSSESAPAYRYNLGMAFENTSNAYYNAILPIPMRSTPTLTYQGSWAIGSKLLSGLTVDSMINNLVKIVCTTSETLTPGKIELLENKEAGINFIDLSADL